MTMDRQPVSSEEWKELFEAIKSDYLARRIYDTDARRYLARLGHNATEIDMVLSEWLKEL